MTNSLEALKAVWSIAKYSEYRACIWYCQLHLTACSIDAVFCCQYCSNLLLLLLVIGCSWRVLPMKRRCLRWVTALRSPAVVVECRLISCQQSQAPQFTGTGPLHSLNTLLVKFWNRIKQRITPGWRDNMPLPLPPSMAVWRWQTTTPRRQPVFVLWQLWCF